MTDPKGTDPLSITLGVEEEFFLVDPATRDLLPDPDPRILEYCDKNRGDHKVVAEFLRSQIETTSRVCTSVEAVRSALMETRRLVIDAASQHGAEVMAASTHPFAAWQHQVVTAGHRYEQFAMTYQQAVRELLVGGGSATVPCLRIENDAGEVHWLYESADIIDYIAEQGLA